MAGAGLLVYTLESSRIERLVTSQITQEIAEFRELRRDPNTGEPFDDVGRLLDVFLTRNVPDDDEMLVGYVEGARTIRTLNRYGQEFLDEPAYLRVLDERADDGGTSILDSATFGEVWVTLVPVRNAQGEGSLVIVNFLADEHEELESTLRTYSVVAFLSLLLITGLGALQSGRLLAPLRTLEETARDISTTDLSRRIPERGNDDITSLTRTINSMFARLDEGFRDQRQFLDDAGHELRTPLTVLRGHLELLDADDPAERAETQELLLEEVDRMSRLVGDLILLAKSRRPDFLVARRGRPRDADPVRARQGPRAGRPRVDPGRGRRPGTAVARRAAHHPGAAPARRQRRQAHRPRRRDRHRVRPHRPRRTPLGARHRRRHRPGRPRDGAAALRPQPGAPRGRGLRPRPLDRPRHPRRPRRDGRDPRRRAPRRPRRAHRPHRSLQGDARGPDPDRRGRAAHRRLHRQGPARRGPPADDGRTTVPAASTRPCPVAST